ncbi:hypothetical protein PoB_001596400 [Plakobranchus ocellatus]|uniref:Uncharacterized protein n=1 Tax=Plakobranchus ocellatus TaxID=259542 RepID=A0AAV3Z2B2_9GAST|nr:hypothetical protein PoB_001596400 [Plakobranchus ocellatus]
MTKQEADVTRYVFFLNGSREGLTFSVSKRNWAVLSFQEHQQHLVNNCRMDVQFTHHGGMGLACRLLFSSCLQKLLGNVMVGY